ncbi:type III pantothenate kinase [Thiolapillus sp.]
MERLYIDLGNSRLKWRRDQAPMQALAYSANRLHGQLTSVWREETPPEQVWLASVAGQVAYDNLLGWLVNCWGLVPHIMEVSAEDCGLRCGYPEPRQLGVDRWAAMIAAHAAFPHGVCVVDCGTAVTLDAVDGRGRHLGGYILPGIDAMQQVLLQETAIERETGAAEAGGEWGNSTVSCIELGTGKALVALIEQSVERMQAAGVCNPGLVLTGGGVGAIESMMQIDYQRRDALVLEGIQLYAEEKSR